MANIASDWPELPYDAWRDTLDTLHMYTQIVGKVRLAMTPFESQWANTPLYLTARGLTTSPIPDGMRAFQLDFDLIDHELTLDDAEGGNRVLKLEPRTVADFYGEVMAMLRDAGIDVEISPGPSEVPDPIPFAEDTVHHSYDPVWANRFWRVLSQCDLVLKAHRARFRGKAHPVCFFWGTFDLTYQVFSGRWTEPTGDDMITRRSTDQEVITAGFWPGSNAFPEPAFYGYAYPPPEGLAEAAVRPAAASWNTDVGEFILRYEDVRRAPSPPDAIREFLESTYEAAATRTNWDPALLR